MEALAQNGGTPVRTRPFPSRRPFGSEAERLAVESIRSQRLYGIGGALTTRLEEGFAELYGAEYAVASSSGTAAIHVALGALGFEPGSEVITGPITDAGSIIPIVFQHGVPVFADLDEGYGMDPAEVERKITERTAAILVVHLFGAATDVRRIREIADRHGIPVVEDCSQAHVTQLGDRYLGRYGSIAAYSLQQSKHMTTGDGGVTVTDDPELARRMSLFRDKGWSRKGYGPRSYDLLGLNYRMTELQAAVGVPQLDTVRAVVLRRQELGRRLSDRIAEVPGIRPQAAAPESEHSYWVYAFEVDRWRPQDFAEALAAEGVPAGAGYIGTPIYSCMRPLVDHHTFGTSGYPFDGPAGGTAGRDPVAYEPGLCPRAEGILSRLVTFGLHEEMTEDDVDDVAAAVQKVATHLPATPISS